MVFFRGELFTYSTTSKEKRSQKPKVIRKCAKSTLAHKTINVTDFYRIDLLGNPTNEFTNKPILRNYCWNKTCALIYIIYLGRPVAYLKLNQRFGLKIVIRLKISASGYIFVLFIYIYNNFLLLCRSFQTKLSVNHATDVICSPDELFICNFELYTQFVFSKLNKL